MENLGPELGNDGSLGLFQQRAAAGWGTASEEQDPTDAAGMFVERLLSVAATGRASRRGWRRKTCRTRPSTECRRRPTTVRRWSAATTRRTGAWPAHSWLPSPHWRTAMDCGGENGAEPAGPASSFGLPAGYAIPSDATPAETLAITYAISKLGDAYVWGAAGPASFDCAA